MPLLKDELKLNSFFSGIGGFEVAFERAGFQVSFHCEKDKFCRSILERHWPNTPCAPDITTLDPKDIPRAQVWTAGFPCQDLSMARTPHGRSGLKGQQSSLFFELRDLMAAHRPEVVLIENVVGLLNSHGGQDFKILLSSLAELGYGVSWRVLNARYFGAAQSRPRVFICAWLKNPANAARALFEDEIAEQPGGEREGFVSACRPTVTGAVVPRVSFCISATSGRHTGLDWARSYVTYPRSVRRLTPRECERLQGFPDDWTVPGESYRVPARGIDTERYHAVGNAVCVPVVEWIANRIMLMLESGNSGRRKAYSTAESLRACAGEFASPAARLFSEPKRLDAVKWRSGGVAYKEAIVDAPASTAPCTPVASYFSEVIERNSVSEKYYLSSNAAQGIIRRVDKMGRRLFAPLDRSLRELAQTGEYSGKPMEVEAVAA